MSSRQTPAERAAPELAAPPATDREGITIVCVYNDPDVRRQCLDRSIQDLGQVATELEYIPIDNVAHQFTSAGAALNHGARLATNDVLLFVHQDVYIHSLDRLKVAAQYLRQNDWGMIGAVGIAQDGTVVGRIRDRVILIGADAPEPVPVDSVDEVLFMVRRDQILEHPLSQANDLSWHAYAVEYGLRLRSHGHRTAAMNLSITHNSLTINLARLDRAHSFVADAYSEFTPVATTCGVVGAHTSPAKSWDVLARHRWRYRWMRDSAVAWSARRRLPASRYVLSDIRIDVDGLRLGSGRPLHIINVDLDGGLGAGRSESLELNRRDLKVVVRSPETLSDVSAELSRFGPDDSVLVTNLRMSDLEAIAKSGGWVEAAMCVGYHHDAGLWLLAGPAAMDDLSVWDTQRAAPVGLRTTGGK